MIEQFLHTAANSFYLWFDHKLLNNGRAFYTKTGTLKYYADDRLDSRYKAFGSQYKQWVTDSSISGAVIPTGIYANSSLQTRSSGVIFDFENGRILSSGINANASVTGQFSVKEFNIYMSNESEDDLLINKTFVESPKIKNPTGLYIPPYDAAVPAVFFSITRGKNDPFAFGGEDTSKVFIKSIVFAETPYQLDGILSLFADTSDTTIPTIPFSRNPYTEFGDLKGGSYSYESLALTGVSGLPFYVEDVDTAKLTDKISKSITNDLHIGFIDFEIHQQRAPRV